MQGQRHADFYPPHALWPLVRMNPDGPRQTLLDELEARQNELLDELDRLNTRIEQVLREGLAWRGEISGTMPAG